MTEVKRTENTETGNETLIEVRDLKTHFHTDDGVVRAVDGVDLKIERGKTIGIVGESGSGKTVFSRSLMRIVQEPPGRVSGQILLHRNGRQPVDLAAFKANASELRHIRGKEIGMIFQEPMSSFSPIHTIGNQIMESLLVHEQVSRREARRLSIDMIGTVGIPRPAERFDAYPFELSGGMRQRAMIAMALMCHPALLIADEPTTALDVTVEAAILNLMKSLQEQMGMTIMIITHDLGVIAKIADEVAVMYLGKVVEQGSVEAIFNNPQHPYTQALLRSMPRLDTKMDRLESIKGTVPDPYTVPPGCTFFPRCGEAQSGLCNVTVPDLVEVEPGHWARCLLREGAPRG